MLDNWYAENKFLDNKIKSFIPEANTMFVKVVATDGFYVNVLPFTLEEGFEVLENIPIMQSKYCSPIIQEGDTGLLFDIRLNMAQLLENNVDIELARQTYYIFLPFVLLEEFQSAPNTYEIKSPDLQTSLAITDGSINASSSASVGITATESLSVTSPSTTITAETETNITTGALSVTSEGDLSIMGGSSPIEIGNGTGTLGAVIDDLVSLMDMLSSGMTGPSTNPAAYSAGKAAIVSKIKQVLA